MNNIKRLSRFNAVERASGVVLSLALLLTIFSGIGTLASTEAEAATDYGLADSIQDGVILHCFDWTYNDIKDELANIAEAGFTSIQTSPAQASASGDQWYWLYQPLGFYMSDSSALGTPDELAELCEEADKYGIKIIVDVVANHLAGDHTDIQSDLTDSTYWHDILTSYSGSTEDEYRYYITHSILVGDGSIANDLATENEYVQNCVKEYIAYLKSLGVDGIRFDAAKSIGLPSEGDDFWSVVTSDDDLWYYGEILSGAINGNWSSSEKELMAEYSTYMSFTDSSYSTTIMSAVLNGTFSSSMYNGNWINSDTSYNGKSVSASDIVYWAESHDDYSNSGEYGTDSSDYSQSDVDRAYALLAARADSTTLYFSRPSSTSKETILIGQKGSTHFTSAQVAEVNKFHNAMIGTSEYWSAEGSAAVVCRGDGSSTGGAVIVTGSDSGGAVSVTNGGSLVPVGTYTDRISGNTFTVTSTTISGTVGNTGIAVIYEQSDIVITAASSANDDGVFTTDTLTITLGLTGADSGTYVTSEGDSGTFTDGSTITIGGSTTTSTQQAIAVKLTASDSDGNSVERTYTYTKKNANSETIIYFDNSSYNWSQVYAYIYDDSGTSVVQNAAWPGELMTYDSTTGYYYIKVDSTLADGYVIFTESSSSTNRYPADEETGMSITDGTSYIFSSGYSWTVYSESAASLGEDYVTITATSSANNEGVFTTDTLTITLSLTGVDSGTYVTSEGDSGTFTNGSTITIGGSTTTSTQQAIAVKLTASDSDGNSVEQTYTYTKKNADSKTIIYFDNSSYNWNQVYAYIYKVPGGDGNQNAAWPGELMTYDSTTGYYYIEVDSEFAGGYVIFTESSAATTNRYPADGETGMSIIDGTSYVFSSGYSWTIYSESAVSLGEAESGEASETVTVNKTLNHAVSDERYTFDFEIELYTIDETGYVKDSTADESFSIDVSGTSSGTKNITLYFDTSTDTTLYYKITEVKGNYSNIDYTSSVYYVVITIKDGEVTNTEIRDYTDKTSGYTTAYSCDFVNERLMGLTVSKTVSGTSTATAFDFTLKVNDDSGGTYTGSLYDSHGNEYTYDSTAGAYSFSLSDGESITLYLPYGYSYTVAESNKYTGYTTTATVNGTAETLSNLSYTNSSITAEQTVAYTNTLKALPGAGGAGLYIFIFIGLILCASSIVFMLVKSRSNRIGGK